MANATLKQPQAAGSDDPHALTAGVDQANYPSDRYYWQATVVLDMLIKAAPRTVVVQAAAQLDGGNTAAIMLRGLSYITHLITSQPEDEVNPKGRDNALSTVSAFTELVSRLVELDTEADTTRACMATNEFRAYMNAADTYMGANHG